MNYTVKEIYYTLQGEGANAGRAAVFLRFAGCNLWTGLEADRPSAVCRFCDTDFVGADGPGGGKFETPEELALAARSQWPSAALAGQAPFVVCTGGEPLLQLDPGLVRSLHHEGFEVAIETNGTMPVPAGVDWVCVSPKAEAPLTVLSGDELKLIYPQPGAEPERYERLTFRHFFLQPMAGSSGKENTRLATQYCLKHPQWRLSLQIHKLVGLP